ncbi:hypothetical protein SUGI_0465340 [Cryptomeria japonica]|nr:hypothetical protein SUGI_0465340 [Cryptomeria japonica]
MDFNGLEHSRQCTPETDIPKFDEKTKSKRPRTDDNESPAIFDMGEKECTLGPQADDREVQEFFALLDRIQSMRMLLKQKQMNGFTAEEISTVQNMGSDVIKRRSLWKPSFEWEDFSILTREDNPSAPRNSRFSANNKVGRSEKSLKPDMGSDKWKRVANFDLNIEAGVENPVPAGAFSLVP